MVKGSQPQMETKEHTMQQSYDMITFTLASELTNTLRIDDDLTDELMSMR